MLFGLQKNAHKGHKVNLQVSEMDGIFDDIVLKIRYKTDQISPRCQSI